MTYYKEDSKTLLYGGRVLLYQLENTKKNSWYARIRLPNERKYVIRSLRTTSKPEALGELETLYRTLLYRSQHGLSTKDITWEQLVKMWAIWRRDTYRRGHRYTELVELKNRIYFQPYFGDTTNLSSITLINDIHIYEWIEWRQNYADTTTEYRKQTLAWNTLSQELSMLKTILSFAANRGYIKGVPHIRNPRPVPPRHQRSRAKADKQFYQTCMRNTLWEHKHHRNKRPRLYSFGLRLCIKLIASSAIRVQELLKLEYRDIQLELDTDDNSFTTIHIRPSVSKVREARTSVCFDGANVYKMLMKWKELRTEYSNTPHISGHNLVFAHPDHPNKAIDLVSSFKHFVRRWEHDEDINKRLARVDENLRPLTLTSFRHMSINNLIANGVDIALIAENAGTSMNIISSSYSQNQSWRNRLKLTSINYRRRVFSVDPAIDE